MQNTGNQKTHWQIPLSGPFVADMTCILTHICIGIYTYRVYVYMPALYHVVLMILKEILLYSSRPEAFYSHPLSKRIECSF